MDTQAIKLLIMHAIPDAEVQIEDLRGDGAQYKAIISAASFSDKSRLEQHRLVHQAIKPQIGHDIHTLSIQTFAKK